MNSLFLSDKDYGTTLAILNQLDTCTKYGFIISGSIVQRALLPEFAKSIRNKPLADLDIVLVGNKLEDCPVLPTIKKYFYVFYINPSFGGYYFGLVHKETGKWVDLFTLPYERKLTSIEIDGKAYPAITLESQVLYLAYDLLSRIKGKRSVREKWIKKLEILYAQTLDETCLHQEFLENKAFFLSALKNEPRSEKKYIEWAINDAKKHMTHNKIERIKLLLTYPSDSIITSNSISVETRFTAFKEMFLFPLLRYFNQS